MLTSSTQVRGFKPGRSRRTFKGEKILSTPSFGGEVKPSVPCRRFAACKRSLNGVEVVISAKLPDNILAHSSHFRRWDLSRRGGRGGNWWLKVGTSKKTERGKQWQATPKNLPGMQRTWTIPVARLNSDLCPDRPKGWITIIIMYILPCYIWSKSILARQCAVSQGTCNHKINWPTWASNAAEIWLDRQLSEILFSGLQMLEQRDKKCIELRGDYVE